MTMTRTEVANILGRVSLLTWMPRSPARIAVWDATDVAHAKGYMLCREHVIALLTVELERIQYVGPEQQTNQQA